MAPVKPMGTPDAAVGFPQKYNDKPGDTNDLNPDHVVDLVTPRAAAKPATPTKVRKARATKKK